jgi:CspA family cold shock protein
MVKSYGFVVPDDKRYGDVLLHMTCLQKSGCSTMVYEGATVTLEAKMFTKGLQAVEVITVDLSTAAPRNAILPGTLPVVASEIFGPERAWCKSFNSRRGFGFLVLEQNAGKGDVFAHAVVLRHCGWKRLLTEGEWVVVSYGRSAKGLVATQITPC